MKKPWSGRFREATRTSVENFTESLSIDYRLYSYNIRGSIAHARMLGDVGLISKTDANKIIKGLKEVEQDIKDGKVDFDPAFEDIHMLDAHRIVGEIVRMAETGHKTLAEFDLSAMKQICPKIAEDVYSVLSCDKIPDRVVSMGGTGRGDIQKNLAYWEKGLTNSGYEKS